jgi:hypothetical protein
MLSSHRRLQRPRKNNRDDEWRCSAVIWILLLRVVTLVWGGRAMVQAVSRRPLTAEARVPARHSPCGICGGQSGNVTGFYRFYLVNIILPLLSILIYHLGDEK